MANLIAFTEFDILAIDLNFYSRFFHDSELQKNANLTLNGIAYPDYYRVNGYDGATDLNLEFLGTGIVENAEGVVTAGTANVIAESDLNAESLRWYVQGVSVSAAAIYDAALTPSSTDELALIETALAGADTVTLSNFSDRMNLYDGNDAVTGGAGNDILNGGSGTDTAIFLSSFESCTIAFEGAVCVITAPGEGTDRLSNFEFATFAGVTRSIASLSDVVAPPPPSTDWRFFTSDGQASRIAGAGQLFGTNGFQDVGVLNIPGSVLFDASFNKGGDIVRLEGNASNWDVARLGSSAVLSDGDTFVQIPVGPVGMAIVFDDGARTLKIDTGTAGMRIGAQSFGTELVEVSAAPDGTTLPTGADVDAGGRIFLAEGETVFAGGKNELFGTGGNEAVFLVEGDFVFDPSFNKGGDTIALVGEAADYTAVRQGSSLKLDSDTQDLLIPVGTAATSVVFSGADDRELLIDIVAGGIRLGDQLIGFMPVALTEFA